MVTPEDLALINLVAGKNGGNSLSEKEVYVFAVKVADNEVDACHEYFGIEALYQLADAIIGKVCTDNRFDVKPRIFRSQICGDGSSRTKNKEPLVWVKAYAYVVRTPQNEAMIANIEQSTERKVSFGCSINEIRCPICRGLYDECDHVGDKDRPKKLCGINGVYDWTLPHENKRDFEGKEEKKMEKHLVYAKYRNGYSTAKEYVWLGLEDFKAGDLIVVDSSNGWGVVEVTRTEPYVDGNKANKYVIGKVDNAVYEKYIKAEQAAAALKKKLEARAKKLQNLALWEMLAKDDPEMQELVDQYKQVIQ